MTDKTINQEDLVEDEAAPGDSDDSDYETDEECLMQVSVSGILQEDLSHLTTDQFSFIDIHSDRPLVTIGTQVFVGEYQDTVGTSVFFTKSENTIPRDQVFSRKPGVEVKYFNATRKRLLLKRVFLNKKNKPVKEKISKPDTTNDETPGPHVKWLFAEIISISRIENLYIYHKD